MRIVYHGVHPEVEVEHEDTTVIEGIKRGEPVEIRTDIAERLVEQDTWDKVITQVPAAPVGESNGTVTTTDTGSAPADVPAAPTPVVRASAPAAQAPDTKES